MVYFLDIKSKYKKRQKSVKIRFLDTNKFGHVDKVPATVKVPSHIKEKSYIVIETEKGEELVKVLGNVKYDKNNPSPYKFLRVASKRDRQTFKEHEKEAVKSLYLCKYLAEKLGLKMNLLKAYIPLNRSKIIFYYVSESRVDFRELVKELAKKLRMRIEMRQVGVRDGVQILGAVGVCGNVCCCHNFIEEFEPVNVEMISEQNLPPLTAKYTGICGRLMCCLAYEKENYALKKELPPAGSLIELNNKFFTIKNYDFIKEVAILVSEDGIQETIPLEEFKNIKPKIIKLPENLNPDCTGNCESCDCPSKSMFNYQTTDVEEAHEETEEVTAQQSEISITLFGEEQTKPTEEKQQETKDILDALFKKKEEKLTIDFLDEIRDTFSKEEKTTAEKIKQAETQTEEAKIEGVAENKEEVKLTELISTQDQLISTQDKVSKKEAKQDHEEETKQNQNIEKQTLQDKITTEEPEIETNKTTDAENFQLEIEPAQEKSILEKVLEPEDTTDQVKDKAEKYIEDKKEKLLETEAKAENKKADIKTEDKHNTKSDKTDEATKKKVIETLNNILKMKHESGKSHHKRKFIFPKKKHHKDKHKKNKKIINFKPKRHKKHMHDKNKNREKDKDKD